MKLAAPRERQIVLALLEYLERCHPEYCWVRVEPVAAMHMALKSKGIMRGGAWKEAPWSVGVADILGLGAKPTMALEVKRPGQKQRDSQVAFQRRIETAGGRYAVVSSIEDAEIVITERCEGRAKNEKFTE